MHCVRYVGSLQKFLLDSVPACLLHVQGAHVPPVSASSICCLCSDSDPTEDFSWWMCSMLPHKNRNLSSVYSCIVSLPTAFFFSFTCMITNSSMRWSVLMSPGGRPNKKEEFHEEPEALLVSLLLITAPSWCRLTSTCNSEGGFKKKKKALNWDFPVFYHQNVLNKIFLLEK